MDCIWEFLKVFGCVRQEEEKDDNEEKKPLLKDEKLHLNVIGSLGVGKATFLNALENENDGIETMNKVDYVNFSRTIKRIKIDIRVWSLCDSQLYESINASYIASDLCWGNILIYDCSRRSTFSDVTGRWSRIIENYDKKNCPILLIANKSDLLDESEVDSPNDPNNLNAVSKSNEDLDSSVERDFVDTQEGEELAEKNNWDFFVLSAKNVKSEALDEVFKLFLERCYEFKKRRDMN